MNLNPVSWFRGTKAEQAYTLGDDRVLQAFFGALSATSSSGVIVTQESALRSLAVLACLIVRSETFAALPLAVLRREGEAKVRDDSHPAYRLLGLAPNEMMTAREFWRWKQLTEDISGNAYARIVWRGTTPREIWPLVGPAPTLHVDRRTGEAAWRYTGDDLTPAGVYPMQDILHFKGPVLTSPFKARSLIDLASESIGINIASEQFFGRLLGNGSHFPGYLETDRDLQPEDIRALRDQLSGYSGVLQAGTIRIFDRGLKYRQNQMSLKDAELTEQMRWQLQSICSIFRVPMAMVQDLTHGTYTNSEQQDLWLAKHTITPICVSTEAVIRQRLFRDQPDYFVRFNLDGLLRGDYKTRAEGDATLVRAGIISRNTARSHYDLDPVPGLDAYLVELNLGRVGEDGSIVGPDSGRTSATSAAGTSSSGPADAGGSPPASSVPPAVVLEPLVSDAIEATRRRVERDRQRGVPLEETVAFVSQRLAPLARAHAAAGLPFSAQDIVARACGKTGDRLATMEET